MGKNRDLNDSDNIEIVDARWTGLNNSENVDLLGFAHTIISGVPTEWPQNETIPSEWQV